MGTVLVGNAPVQNKSADGHRPALDGLRAVAVVAVLLYHGGVSWARGGFLGVDVFFVISGYLITALLLGEHERWGSVDLRKFWVRRARRLFPALLLVLTAVAGYAALLADSTKVRAIRLDGLATLAYVANWRFIASGQSYFDQFGDPSPLRHMWSLGIEEQWYLLFPPLLVLLLRARLTARLLPWLLTAAAAASACLGAALYTPGRDPSRVYFGTDTRAQALLVGAVLAVGLSRRQLPLGSTASRTRLATVWPGAALLLLLGLSQISESSAWLYRGGLLLVALLSAAVVTAAVTTEANLVQRVLSLGLLQHLGVVSYGLYLWHWPLYVALSPDRTGLSGTALLLLRLTTSLVAAEVSYQLVEQPVRSGVLGRRLRPLRLRMASSVTVGGVVGLLLLSTTGATAAIGDAAGSLQVTASPSRAGDIKVFLSGDSSAFTLAYNYKQGTVPHLSLASSAKLGCGLLRSDRLLGARVERVQAKCLTWPTDYAAGVRMQRPDVVVLITGAWDVLDHSVNGNAVRLGTPAFENYLDGELDIAVAALGSTGARVVLSTVPCYAERDSGQEAEVRQIRNDPKRTAWLSGAFERYVARSGGRLGLLDLRPLLCPGPQALPTTVEGERLRYDGIHFSVPGAAAVWRRIGTTVLGFAPAPVGTKAAG